MTVRAARGPGRPRTGRGRDGARLEVRMTTDERARVDAAAQDAGVTASEYARRAVLERVTR